MPRPSYILALVMIVVGCVVGLALKHPVLGLVGGVFVAGLLIGKLGDGQ